MRASGSGPVAPVIEVESFVKRYHDLTAVNGVSFQVDEGEIFGILGPNGSGKTSLVESLQGLRTRDGGLVSVLGLDPSTQADKLRRLIGSQLQDSALPDRVKVWEVLDFFASLRASGRPWVDVLGEWGLSDKRNARFVSLSGGQQQRLFVALSLIGEPRLVFLDEMTTGLDPASRRVAWELIKRIRDKGTTVVLVTHSMDEAETLCDRLMILNHGAVVADGEPSHLIDRYGGGVRVMFTIDTDDASWLADVPYVNSWTNNSSRYLVQGDGPVLAHVASALVAQGHAPVDLRQEKATLEDIYLTLTSTNGARQ